MLICFSCQFVVKEDGDIKANLLDPDIPLKWEHIEEVVSITYIKNFYYVFKETYYLWAYLNSRSFLKVPEIINPN